MYDNNYNDIILAQNGNKEKMSSLVCNNMGLVYSISKRFQGRGYEPEDLNQIGTLGLIKAIKNFNTNYEVQLSTYSVPYILGEIKRYIRDDGSVKVSRSVKETSAKINLLKKEYYKKNNKEISIDDIAKYMKISKEDVIFALDATSNNTVVSIDDPIYDSGDGKICVGDTLQSNKNEEQEITNKLSIEKLIDELNDRDKQIIIMRYFKGNTQTEVSRAMGISQVQISRIEKKVLHQMREKII